MVVAVLAGASHTHGALLPRHPLACHAWALGPKLLPEAGPTMCQCGVLWGFVGPKFAVWGAVLIRGLVLAAHAMHPTYTPPTPHHMHGNKWHLGGGFLQHMYGFIWFDC